MNLDHEVDLTWYYGGEAQAAIGLKSNHAAFEHACLVGPGNGGGQPGDHVSDRQLEAAERHRRIRNVLARCSRETQATLRAHYEPRNWRRHPEVPIVLGRLAGVVARLASRANVPIDLASVCAVVHTRGRGLPTALATVSALRIEATKAIARAIEDYRLSSPSKRRQIST